jgi:hypothetical protein
MATFSRPGSIVLETAAATETGSFPISLVLFDGSLTNTGRIFEYRKNPELADIEPRQHLIQ